MKKIITIVIFICLLFCSSNIFTNTSSPGGGYTDAPGEANCGNCHAAPLTSGSVWNNITLTSTVPFNSFIGGNTYTMTLTFSDPSSVKYGFQVTAVSTTATASSPTLGTFSVPASNTEVQEHNGYMLGRSCVAHTSSGTSAITNTKTWTFDWTAPATISTTPVKFYVSINSTDNDNSTSGDQPYTKTFSATVMPVKWLDFTASRLGDIINLKWRTASEINNSHFEVEHSIDGEKWLNVGKVKGYGNSNTINNYTFTYNYLTNNKAYFRLKQVDFNGTFEYSKKLVVNTKNDLSNSVLWISEQRKLIFEDMLNKPKNITIFSMQGGIIQDTKLSFEDVNFDLSFLQKGVYLIRLNCDKDNYFKKIVINYN
jgi:hypothetical protein